MSAKVFLTDLSRRRGNFFIQRIITIIYSALIGAALVV